MENMHQSMFDTDARVKLIFICGAYYYVFPAKWEYETSVNYWWFSYTTRVSVFIYETLIKVWWTIMWVWNFHESLMILLWSFYLHMKKLSKHDWVLVKHKQKGETLLVWFTCSFKQWLRKKTQWFGFHAISICQKMFCGMRPEKETEKT
jgi:hypothetical protein